MREKWIILTEKDCQRLEYPYPSVGKNSLDSWIRKKIMTLYPGNPENLVWDYARQNGKIIIYYLESEKLKKNYPDAKSTPRFRYGNEKRVIFRENSHKLSLKNMMLLLLLYLIVGFGLIGLPYDTNNRLKREYQELVGRVDSERNLLSESIIRRDYLNELDQKIGILEKSAPPDLYNRISLITPYFKLKDRIISLSISEDDFQCRAMGEDPLLLINRMNEDSHFLNVYVDSIETNEKLGKEVFTFKGTFHE